MLSAVLANATQSGMDDTPAEVIFLVFGFSNNGCDSRCYKKKTKKIVFTNFRVIIVSEDIGSRKTTPPEYNLTDGNERKVVRMRVSQKAHRTRYIF